MELGRLTRTLLAPALVTGLATTGLVATPADAATAAKRRPPAHLNLPNGFQPEGITIRGGPRAYLGSRGDGSIYAANLRTGRGRIISRGDGTPAVGLKLDGRKQLWVAGGNDGDAKVVNVRNGRVLANFEFTSGDSFVNDVVLRKGSAWFTDSRRAVLYQVTPRNGQAAQSSIRTVPLGGAWQQVPDENNANGISTTPDGRALLVIQSATGYLFRVNPRTGVATRVGLGSTLLTNGDGLLRQGRKLFVVQNRLNKVAVVKLTKRGRFGKLVRTRTSADFDVPTTIASWRNGLYLPNARFGIAEPTTAAYWITRLGR